MNKFKIKAIRITNCKIKKGFYFYDETDGKEDIYIAANNMNENKEVMKLLAVDVKDDKEYPIKLTQYKQILKSIRKVSDNYLKDLEDGVYIIQGFYDNIRINVKKGDKVEICDIDIIDKRKLYDRVNRYSTVINRINDKYVIQIDKTGEVLTVFRDNIRKINNFKTFVNLI